MLKRRINVKYIIENLKKKIRDDELRHDLKKYTLTPTTIEWARESYSLSEMCYQLGERLEREGHHLEAIKYYVKADVTDCYQPAKDKLKKASCEDSVFDVESNDSESFKTLSPEDLFFLGYQYYTGIGINANIEKAFQYFKEAAERGYAPARVQVGQMYEYDYQDQQQAMKWYLLAAKQGNVTALGHVGRMYHCGLGVDADRLEAETWLVSAAEQGCAYAQRILSISYRTGEEANKWLVLAAEQGDSGARLTFTILYDRRSRKGIEQYVETAMKVFRLEAERGDEEAKRQLAQIYKENLQISAYTAIEARRAYPLCQQAKRHLERCAKELPYQDGYYHLVIATRVETGIARYTKEIRSWMSKDFLLTDQERLNWLQKTYDIDKSVENHKAKHRAKHEYKEEEEINIGYETHHILFRPQKCYGTFGVKGLNPALSIAPRL